MATQNCAVLETGVLMNARLSELQWNTYRADVRAGWRLLHQHWSHPDQATRQWLCAPGSLTRRLQAISAGTFRVRVVSEGWVYRTAVDSGLSASASVKQMMWSRQVVLGGFGESWVAAHSLIPISTIKGRQRQLLHLGSRPLGGFLFKQRSLERGALEICRIKNIWGRRSLFFLESRPLLVAEFFLPDLIRRTRESA